MRLPDPPLLVVSDRGQAVRPLLDVVTAALRAGCRWISLREKDLTASEQIFLAESFLPTIRRFGARLTLHGDVEIAMASELDGVHLPDGGDPQIARLRWGKDPLIGLSIHDIEQARLADPAVLDYVIVGPVYATASKPGYGPALSAGGLAGFARAITLPIIAIGGITPAAIPEVMAAGAAGVAVMGSVMRAGNPRQEVEALLAALEQARAYPRPR